MRVYMVWNNWIPTGSPYELSELLGVYDDYHKAYMRLHQLAVANGVNDEFDTVFHLDTMHTETNYYYIEDRDVE